MRSSGRLRRSDGQRVGGRVDADIALQRLGQEVFGVSGGMFCTRTSFVSRHRGEGPLPGIGE